MIHNKYCSISSFHFCAKSNIMLRFHKPKVKMEARVKNSKNIDSSRKIATFTDQSYEQQLLIWNLRPCRFTRFYFLVPSHFSHTHGSKFECENANVFYRYSYDLTVIILDPLSAVYYFV